MSSRDSYHHGDLKATILAEAAVLVAERGADGLSLRELARAAGVSHAAPAHHFTDRRGLFTALATEGFRMLADALTGARPDFLDAALAYVRFAIDHPGHYAVMFDKSLYDADRPRSRRRRDAAGAELAAASAPSTIHAPRTTPRRPHSRHGLWYMAFRLLWLNGAIDTDRPDPIGHRCDRVAGMLVTRVARLR